MGAVYKPGDVLTFFSEVSAIDHICTTLVGRILPEGVHPSHFVIINYMVRLGDGKTPLALANAMQVTKATMSYSLKVLESRGFVETRPCARDARSKQVFLTGAGRAFHNEAIEVAARTFNNFLQDEDRQTMTDTLPALHRVRRLLEQNREPMRQDELPQDREAPEAKRQPAARISSG